MHPQPGSTPGALSSAQALDRRGGEGFLLTLCVWLVGSVRQLDRFLTDFLVFYNRDQPQSACRQAARPTRSSSASAANSRPSAASRNSTAGSRGTASGDASRAGENAGPARRSLTTATRRVQQRTGPPARRAPRTIEKQRFGADHAAFPRRVGTTTRSPGFRSARSKTTAFSSPSTRAPSGVSYQPRDQHARDGEPDRDERVGEVPLGASLRSHGVDDAALARRRFVQPRGGKRARARRR